LPSNAAPTLLSAEKSSTQLQLIGNIWELCEGYFLKIEGEKRSFAVYQWQQQTWSFELNQQQKKHLLQIKTVQNPDLGLETMASQPTQVLYHVTLHKEEDCLNCQVQSWPVEDLLTIKAINPTEAKLITIYQLLIQLKQFTSAYQLRQQLFAI
jgi:hypothetical protein